MSDAPRGTWRSRYGFLLAVIGSAVGLGNIWRFPFVAYKNGGGAFLIPYLVALFSIGIPLMILELSVGHKFRASAPLAFKRIGRRWELLGWWMTAFVFFGIAFYYCVIVAWCVNYFGLSFSAGWGSSTGKFFSRGFLHTTDGPFNFGGFNWLIVLALALVWFINWIAVFKGVRKGIENISKVLIPALAVIMVVLVVWSLTLPGAVKGISAYLTPDFAVLLNLSIWRDAFSQTFFSLSLGFGVMITYGSYLPSKTNIKSSAVIACVADAGFAILAGFAVFAILGYMSKVSGKPVADVVSAGHGLAFVTYPAAINMLPFGKELFGALFFAALLFAGITSSISIFEASVSPFVDKFGWPRKKVASIMAPLGFAGGLIFTTGAGIYWLDLIDFMLNNFGLLVAGILEAVAVGWIYRTRSIRLHIRQALSTKGLPMCDFLPENECGTFCGKVWEYAVMVWIPLVLGFLVLAAIAGQIQEPYSNYSWWFIAPVGIGWLALTLFAALFIKSRGWRTPPAKEGRL